MAAADLLSGPVKSSSASANEFVSLYAGWECKFGSQESAKIDMQRHVLWVNAVRGAYCIANYISLVYLT